MDALGKMDDTEVLISGRSSMAAALGVTAVATVLFGALSIYFMFGHDQWRDPQGAIGIAFAAVAILCWPWQILDTRNRQFVLTGRGLIYRSGVLSSSELEVPYGSMLAVAVRQGPIQRMFGCGDVRISAPGVTNRPLLQVSSADAHSISLKSIPEFREVSALLRERLPA